MPARIIGRVRSAPRAWGRITENVPQLMTDQAWIVRRVQAEGTTARTPTFNQDSWGPYAALLSEPSWQERRDADRYETDVTHTMAIASDVRPYTSDFIDVAAGPNDSATAAQNEQPVVRYRVVDVQDRTTRFGATLIYHVQLAKLEED